MSNSFDVWILSIYIIVNPDQVIALHIHRYVDHLFSMYINECVNEKYIHNYIQFVATYVMHVGSTGFAF